MYIHNTFISSRRTSVRALNTSAHLATKGVGLPNLGIDGQKEHSGIGGLAEGVGIEVDRVGGPGHVRETALLHKVAHEGGARAVHVRIKVSEGASATRAVLARRDGNRRVVDLTNTRVSSQPSNEVRTGTDPDPNELLRVGTCARGRGQDVRSVLNTGVQGCFA